jgi:hypothetical protein
MTKKLRYNSLDEARIERENDSRNLGKQPLGSWDFQISDDTLIVVLESRELHEGTSMNIYRYQCVPNHMPSGVEGKHWLLSIELLNAGFETLMAELSNIISEYKQ